MNMHAFTAAALAATLAVGAFAAPQAQARNPAPAPTIVDVASGVCEATGQFCILVAAIEAADPAVAARLSSRGQLTVFAPTNAAFADIQSTVDTLLKPENKEDLKDVLTYHVVPGSYPASALEDGQELTTVQGEKLTVSIDGDVVKVNDATVEQADVNASNGVVHVIDGVLVPPAS